jgi:anti-anti-sigma factor
MPITRSSHNDHLIVAIKGRLDARFIQEEREDLDRLLSEVKDVILFDLSRTDFIDSSGIGFLVYIYKRIKPQKLSMAIIGLNGQPKEIVQMLGGVGI